MKAILILISICTSLLAQEYSGGSIKSVTVTDTSIFIVTAHDGTMYEKEMKYIGDYYVIKKGKLVLTIDTAEVTPEVRTKEVLKFKKINKIK